MTKEQIEARHKNNHRAELHSAPRDCLMCRYDLLLCTGSKRYDTPFAAQAAVRTNGAGFVWYACRWCDGFHIGERTAPDRREARNTKDRKHANRMREKFRQEGRT